MNVDIPQLINKAAGANASNGNHNDNDSDGRGVSRDLSESRRPPPGAGEYVLFYVFIVL